MKCTACNKELNKKTVLFDEHIQPFCNNPMICGDEHPNSIANIVKRGGGTEMYSETGAIDVFISKLPENKQDRIRSIATAPQSVRIMKYDFAVFLDTLTDTKDITLVDAIRYCIEFTMKHDKPKEFAVEVAEHDPIQDEVEEVQHVEETPQEEVKEEIQEVDDELVF